MFRVPTKALLLLSILGAMSHLCAGHAIRVHGAVEVGDEIANMLKRIYERLTGPQAASYPIDGSALVEYIQQYFPEITNALGNKKHNKAKPQYDKYGESDKKI